MRVVVFGSQRFEEVFFSTASQDSGLKLEFLEAKLNAQTATLARDAPAICAFVSDRLDRATLNVLAEGGTQVIALRCAGFNNVDLRAAEALGLTVLRVPAYSPYAVAEHTVGLMLTLNRRFHRAYSRVREGNFSLDGLLGFDMHKKTVGIVGTGQIGQVLARILSGFGCSLLAYDPYPNEVMQNLGATYCPLPVLFERSDIISLHCPLTPKTHHLVNQDSIRSFKSGVMLINTSRGAVVDTKALIEGLKSGQIGSVGLDVYEEEADLFFQDLSSEVIQDDLFARLQTFPNVVMTAHQAFFTREALQNIADTTIQNLTDFRDGTVKDENRVTAKYHVGGPS